MFRPTRNLVLLTALLLAACGRAAGAEPSPQPPTALPEAQPTATLPPPSPTATAVPPTATPTAIPPTATPIPPTATPQPTATPTPGPGSVILAESFEHLDGWSEFSVPDSSRFTFDARNDRLHVEVDGDYLTAYLFYDTDLGYADVQIDADVETIAGPNRNNISLICRSTDKGWYEFSMYSGGLWEIWKYVDESYISLASGGSTAIHMQKAKNHLTAVCQEEKLTLYVNDVEVGSATDNQFFEGQVGVSVSTFDITGAVVEFDNFTVTLPDPDNPPGLAVAPTVPPSSGGDSGDQTGGSAYPTVPVPGQTLADAQLQQDVLLFVVLYEVVASPNCQNRQVTNTEVLGVTQDFQFENGILVAGEWSERWTINSCGVSTAYRVQYQADGSGGVFFSISKQ
jgi:hypothetical protein